MHPQPDLVTLVTFAETFAETFGQRELNGFIQHISASLESVDTELW